MFKSCRVSVNTSTSTLEKYTDRAADSFVAFFLFFSIHCWSLIWIRFTVEVFVFLSTERLL